MKRKAWGILLLALILVLAGCGSRSSSDSGASQGSGSSPAASESSDASGEQSGKREPVFIRFVSSTPGGIWYPPATAMELIITQNVENVSVRVSPGGGEANVRTVGKGEAELGYTQTSSAASGYQGLPPFEQAYTDVRHLFTTTPVGMHFAVRKNSDIYSIADLKDKRIGMAPEGYLANTIAERLFELYGFTLEDIKKNGGTVSYLGLTEGPQSLIDGNVDVYLGQGLWPYAPFMEIDNNPGVRFLEIDEEIIQQFLEKYPIYSRFTIPKDTYKSLNKDLETVGTYAAVIANANVPEDVIYDMVKAIFENVEQVHKASPPDKDWLKLENALNGVSIPVHPGAKKYYEEMGLEVKE